MRNPLVAMCLSGAQQGDFLFVKTENVWSEADYTLTGDS